MLHPSDFLITLSVMLMQGCAHTNAPIRRVPVCLTDPAANTAACDGVTVPYSTMYDYECHKLDDHEDYLKARCK